MPPRRSVQGIRNEEQLIPVIRAKLAQRMAAEGYRVRDISRALNVTHAAVTQYLGKKRGSSQGEIPGLPHARIDSLVSPLAEKVIKRVQAGLGPVETAELLDVAHHMMIIGSGRATVTKPEARPEALESLLTLRERLQLELKAAEKYLEISNRVSDDYAKLFLRMIASDSIRHGDVVSQLISWLEAGGGESAFAVPGEDVLSNMLSLEDSANEASLTATIKVNHPVARLLLEWIDIDEAKHEKLVGQMLRFARSAESGGRTGYKRGQT